MNAIWDKVREHWDSVFMLIGLVGFSLFAYFAADGLPAWAFLWGLPFLYRLRSFKGFVPVAAISGLILLLAFFRSDFVELMLHGRNLGQAYAESKRYFQAPMIIWFTTLALIFAMRDYADAKAPNWMTLLGWAMIALCVVQLLDCLSKMGLRTLINHAADGGKRTEVVIVHMSNSNSVLLMMFWPLAMWFARGRNYAYIGFLAFTILVTAWYVDTNAQILALLLGGLVFLATRFWPAGLSLRGITPERVAAVVASASIIAFPLAIRALMASGKAEALKPHLSPSWAQRVDIWTFTVARANEKPWWGWGYESVRQFDPTIPNHPHNLALQAWMELGVPGLALSAALWGAIFWFMAPKGAPMAKVDAEGMRDINAVQVVADDFAEQFARPYCLALAVGFLTIGMVSYGLWRMWFYVLGALAVAVCVMAVKAVREQMRLQN